MVPYIYADYEIDVTGSKHKPYLCCVCDDKKVKIFTGSDLIYYKLSQQIVFVSRINLFI